VSTVKPNIKSNGRKREAVGVQAEILSVGTEILLGDIVNTNAAYLARELAALGVNCFYQTSVGDNASRLRHALDIAFSRADLVVTTGGLGPTQDDLTKETVASYLGVPLVFHEPSWEHIKAIMATRGREPQASQRREAMMPVGARVLSNGNGTANGVWLRTNIDGTEKTVVMLPGRQRNWQARQWLAL
jgi:nicotinamide-nucleotide amidase